MPKRLLLEGSDIEELLSQVRDEHGPGVSIVSADRVRTGGFAGFFARQRYELTVEVPDPAERPAAPASAPQAAPAAPAAPADPMTVLLARAEEQERRLSLTGSRAAPPAAAAAPQRPAAAAPSVSLNLAQAVPAQANVPTHAAAPAAPTVQTLPAAPAVPLVPEDFVVETGTENRAFADMLASLQRDGDTGATGALPARAYQAPAAGPERSGAVVPRAFQPPVVEQERPFERALTELGLPARMARQAVGPDMYTAVKRALADLPEAPPAPRGPGDVLVIVGETHAALHVAEKAARLLNVGPAQVLLAARSTAGTGIHNTRLLNGPRSAQQRARKIHRDDVPYVVVVDSTPEQGNGEWARAIADGLGATAVWAVVDATRKTADTARHLRTLGKVDAIAVNAVAATGDPASVLDLDIPVSHLADRPGTAQAWAALLCERLEEKQS
ncbi:hypothetical protein Ppa06_67780 [Planomonospora parontospora subsp. parontospora]|uniref:Uncharacterized protein n=2 Tax=Planomonospora parontospora TaxID=58119 RepID=A0AA37BNG7_9ACTN|nr:hypothetical protein [Planomonospora parontospora]GGK95932.1 hypothetical protein GCM10010126_64190 [Planomonospora parontospora]GII12980.1 hypothetical protein Ppa06_67780 [Planomonospora parontospora subsp. parontospora]